MNTKGFTLLEILVAMCILTMIMCSVVKIYTQAGIAWDTGMEAAEINTIGRAIIDCVSVDVQGCIYDSNTCNPTMSGFWVLSGTNPLERVSYSSGAGNISRNGVEIFRRSESSGYSLSAEMDLDFGWMEKKNNIRRFRIGTYPSVARCVLMVRRTDKHHSEERVFTSLTFLPIINRYTIDELDEK